MQLMQQTMQPPKGYMEDLDRLKVEKEHLEKLMQQLKKNQAQEIEMFKESQEYEIYT